MPPPSSTSTSTPSTSVTQSSSFQLLSSSLNKRLIVALSSVILLSTLLPLLFLLLLSKYITLPLITASFCYLVYTTPSKSSCLLSRSIARTLLLTTIALKTLSILSNFAPSPPLLSSHNTHLSIPSVVIIISLTSLSSALILSFPIKTLFTTSLQILRYDHKLLLPNSSDAYINHLVHDFKGALASLASPQVSSPSKSSQSSATTNATKVPILSSTRPSLPSTFLTLLIHALSSTLSTLIITQTISVLNNQLAYALESCRFMIIVSSVVCGIGGVMVGSLKDGCCQVNETSARLNLVLSKSKGKGKSMDGTSLFVNVFDAIYNAVYCDVKEIVEKVTPIFVFIIIPLMLASLSQSHSISDGTFSVLYSFIVSMLSITLIALYNIIFSVLSKTLALLFIFQPLELSKLIKTSAAVKNLTLEGVILQMLTTEGSISSFLLRPNVKNNATSLEISEIEKHFKDTALLVETLPFCCDVTLFDQLCKAVVAECMVEDGVVEKIVSSGLVLPILRALLANVESLSLLLNDLDLLPLPSLDKDKGNKKITTTTTTTTTTNNNNNNKQSLSPTLPRSSITITKNQITSTLKIIQTALKTKGQGRHGTIQALVPSTILTLYKLRCGVIRYAKSRCGGEGSVGGMGVLKEGGGKGEAIVAYYVPEVLTLLRVCDFGACDLISFVSEEGDWDWEGGGSDLFIEGVLKCGGRWVERECVEYVKEVVRLSRLES